MTNLAENLEYWMTSLPEELRRMPIVYLAIPGSHDSMSYGIDDNAEIAPDAEPVIRSVYSYLPWVVRRWARTQKFTTLEQLNHGIRYFDLRLATKQGDENFYFVHSLYCETINKPFEQIIEFLDSHPKELVLLDFQHFYQFQDADHRRLKEYVVNLFGERLFGKNQNKNRMLDLTLQRAEEQGRQVIIIYRETREVVDKFWYGAQYLTPWPDTTRVSDLQEFLQRSLKKRKFDIGFVSQMVITPDAWFIVPRFYSSLKTQCAKKVCKRLYLNWLTDQNPGEFIRGENPKSNVFIADFIDIQDCEFPKIVVNLNRKLLKDQMEDF